MSSNEQKREAKNKCRVEMIEEFYPAECGGEENSGEENSGEEDFP